jgi:uncharacterized membrane protein
MNLKSVLFVIGIVSLVFMPTALASKVEVSLKDTGTGLAVDSSNPFSACPGPLHSGYISVYVKNTGSRSDTYSLSLSLPEGWEGLGSVIKNEITLAPGEEILVNPFLINMPSPQTLLPGLYEVSIEASSVLSGDRDEAVLPINILPCYAVSVTPLTETQEICEEDVSASGREYEIEIFNSGKFDDTYSLSASEPWVSFSSDSVSIASGKKKTVTATLSPPEGLSGKRDIVITAESSTSYSSAKGTISLDIRDCFDFSLSLQPSQSDVCLGEEALYTLEITNLGDEDSYTLEFPDFVSSNISGIISIPAGKKSLTLSASPSRKGLISVDIAAKSENDPSLSRTARGFLNVKECRGIAVILSPPEKTVCEGEGVEYAVTMKNTGTIEETFSIEASRGTLEADSVSLRPDETKTVTLSIVPEDIFEEEIVTVTASADGISDSANSLLTSENCYDAGISISPSQASVCPCSTLDYRAVLENRGKLSDTYTFSYSGGSPEKVTLQPGKKKIAEFSVDISCDQEGDYTVMAEASSENINVSASSVLDVKSMETCFGVEITNGKSAAVEVFKGIAIPVKVRNSGEKEQEFSLDVEGPDWVFLSPSKLSLAGGEEENVYLYASPPFGTKEGKYSARISTSSAYSEGSYELSISVGKGGVEIIVEEEEKAGGENETKKSEDENKSLVISPGEGITLNVSFENITGEIIKKTEIPPFKTIAIGVITIIIIIILVIRFAILMGK